MSGKISFLLDRLNTSLWPIPVVFCLLGALIAILMVWLDNQLAVKTFASWWPQMESESARQVLSVIAGSVVSVAGVVFSITMVALTLTSGQYGPRVLRKFLEDLFSKITLGLFLGTHVYTLVVLSGYAVLTTPRFTIITAIALALLSLFAFVQFIHLTAVELQADQIVQRIGRQLRSALTEATAEQAFTQRRDGTLSWRRAVRGTTKQSIGAAKEGYVQAIDYAALTDWCKDNDLYLCLRARSGDFLITGLPLFDVYGVTSAADPEQWIDELHEMILLGNMRTPRGDAEFTITQLNQLAARALSPGINDPGTAITCIDWYGLSLGEIVDRDFPGSVYVDADEEPRMLVRTTDFSGLLKAVYAPLRQMAHNDLSVTLRLLESLSSLAQLTSRTGRLEQLGEQGALIMDGVDDSTWTARDRCDLRRRGARLKRLTERRLLVA